VAIIVFGLAEGGREGGEKMPPILLLLRVEEGKRSRGALTHPTSEGKITTIMRKKEGKKKEGRALTSFINIYGGGGGGRGKATSLPGVNRYQRKKREKKRVAVPVRFSSFEKKWEKRKERREWGEEDTDLSDPLFVNDGKRKGGTSGGTRFRSLFPTKGRRKKEEEGSTPYHFRSGREGEKGKEGEGEEGAGLLPFSFDGGRKKLWKYFSDSLEQRGGGENNKGKSFLEKEKGERKGEGDRLIPFILSKGGRKVGEKRSEKQLEREFISRATRRHNKKKGKKRYYVGVLILIEGRKGRRREKKKRP